MDEDACCLRFEGSLSRATRGVGLPVSFWRFWRFWQFWCFGGGGWDGGDGEGGNGGKMRNSHSTPI